MSLRPLPPFTDEVAAEKVRLAEDEWNSCDAAGAVPAYTPDSQRRNRAKFVQGRDSIAGLLSRKWSGELDYRLNKELWVHRGNHIAVRFAYDALAQTAGWTSFTVQTFFPEHIETLPAGAVGTLHTA